VIQGESRTRLALEPIERRAVPAVIFRQNLERHAAVQPRIFAL